MSGNQNQAAFELETNVQLCKSEFVVRQTSNQHSDNGTADLIKNSVLV
jgi:hypothetical protein